MLSIQSDFTTHTPITMPLPTIAPTHTAVAVAILSVEDDHIITFSDNSFEN